MGAGSVFSLLFIQILFWIGLVYSALLFLCYRKMAGWYNRRAGEKIVTHFRFRSLLPLVLTLVCMPVAFVVSEQVYKPDLGTGFIIMAGCLSLVCPVAWLVWRLVKAGSSANPRAGRWRLLYDVLLNLSIASGGVIVMGVAVALTVLASFTKWDRFFPKKWREFSGVDVVPATKTHYLVAAGLAVVALATQFFADSERLVGTILSVVLLVAVGMVLWQVWHTPRGERRAVAWRWGFIAVSSYMAFIATVWLIVIALVLLALYLVLTFVGGGKEGESSGNGRYKVSCDQLSHDILGGSNRCNLSGNTCQAIDGGSCPYK